MAPTPEPDAPGVAPADGTAETLWQRFVRARDPELRNELVERYLPFCRSIAVGLYARRQGLAAEFVDYMQLATLGLIEAVDHYAPERGVLFELFAHHRIRGAVLNSLEGLSETYQQSSLRRRLRSERMESLRTGAAARAAGRDVLAELATFSICTALGYMLEDSGMFQNDGGERAYRQDFYDHVAARQLREGLALLVDALPPQERRVVRYHYYQGLGFTEIAALMGLTKGRISQIHRQALQLIREAHRASRGVRLDL